MTPRVRRAFAFAFAAASVLDAGCRDAAKPGSGAAAARGPLALVEEKK